MNPVRPSPMSPLERSIQPARDEAKLAAQRAFFQAAMGRAGAPDSPAAAPAPVHAQRTHDAQAPAPQKILRPGSLLDIRV